MSGRRDASLLSSLLLPALLLVALLLPPAGAAGNVGEYTAATVPPNTLRTCDIKQFSLKTADNENKCLTRSN